MNFEDAKNLTFSKLTNPNLQKHCLAVSQVMRHLANRFNQDEEKWAIAGMLHDLDYQETLSRPEKHSLLTVEWLSAYNLDPEILSAIKAHSGKAERNTLINQAIWCADPITGFLVACALIGPDKKIEPVDARFALKRMKEKRFAQGASREQIQACTEMGLSLEEFLEISLKAMKEIKDELGL